MGIEGKYKGSIHALLGMQGIVDSEHIIKSLLLITNNESIDINLINKASEEGVIYLDIDGVPLDSNSKIDEMKATYKLLYSGYDTPKGEHISISLKRTGLGWTGSYIDTTSRIILHIANLRLTSVQSNVNKEKLEKATRIAQILHHNFEFKGKNLYEILKHNESLGNDLTKIQLVPIIKEEDIKKEVVIKKEEVSEKILTEGTIYDKIYDLLLIKENWKISNKNRLRIYLSRLLTKVRYEQSISDAESYTGNGYVLDRSRSRCLINTGLIDKFNNDIYVVDFHNNIEDIDKKRIELFRSKSSLVDIGFYKEDIMNLPKPIIFYNDVRELIFKANIEEFDLNDTRMLNHVLNERIHRFPEQYRDTSLNILAERVLSSLRTALKIAERDYKYIVPMYNLKFNCIQYLVPIHLNNTIEEGPEVALVVGEGNGFYHMYTILDLDTAYDNARLLCRPDSNWLKLE